MRRFFMLFLLGIMTLLLCASFVKANGQNKQLLSQQQQFKQGEAFIEQNEYEHANDVLTDLLQKTQTPLIYYKLGLSEASVGHTQLASEYMYEVLKLDPHYSEMILFMLQFSEVLIMNNDFEKAGKVLEKCSSLLQINENEKYKPRVAQLFEYIAENEENK